MWLRSLTIVAMMVLGLAAAQAADFGFPFDNIEQQFADAQRIGKVDIGLEKLKCYDEGKSRACTFKTNIGAVLILGTKGTQVDSMIVALDKPGLKSGLRMMAVSALAIGLGSGVTDKKEFRKGLDTAMDSYTDQIVANPKTPKIEVAIGTYKWTLFRVNPDKDEMFVTVSN